MEENKMKRGFGMGEVDREESGAVINMEQAEEFFRAVTPSGCPFCGGSQWSFLVNPDEGADLTHSLPIAAKSSSPPPNRKVYPRDSVFIECATCGFMRAHSAKIISEWIASKKDEE